MFLFVLRAFVSFSSLSSPSSLSSLPFVPCIHTHTCQMVLRETAVSAPHLRGGRDAMLRARGGVRHGGSRAGGGKPALRGAEKGCLEGHPGLEALGLGYGPRSGRRPDLGARGEFRRLERCGGQLRAEVCLVPSSPSRRRLPGLREASPRHPALSDFLRRQALWVAPLHGLSSKPRLRPRPLQR